MIISVRDDRIPEVAARLVGEGRLRARAGRARTRRARTAARTLLRPRCRTCAASATLHPLVSFADARVAVEELHEVAFGIEGDEPARAVARRIVRALGARAVFAGGREPAALSRGRGVGVELRRRAGRHGAALLVKAGVPAEQALPALIPLLSSVVQNLAQVGLPGALTGPVERGDVSSVEHHLRALESRAPELLEPLPSDRPGRAAAGAREGRMDPADGLGWRRCSRRWPGAPAGGQRRAT